MAEIHIVKDKSRRHKPVLVITGDLDKDNEKDTVMVYLTSGGKKSKGARVWLSSLDKPSKKKTKKSSKSKKSKKSTKSKKKSKKRKR
jgi:hypothetical protein